MRMKKSHNQNEHNQLFPRSFVAGNHEKETNTTIHHGHEQEGKAAPELSGYADEDRDI